MAVVRRLFAPVRCPVPHRGHVSPSPPARPDVRFSRIRCAVGSCPPPQKAPRASARGAAGGGFPTAFCSDGAHISRLSPYVSDRATAAAHLPQRPAMHIDETGCRVGGRIRWLHIVTDGTLTVKFPNRKRGREAIDGIGIVPRCRGVPIHDCRASYPGYDQCGDRLCGSHLLREPNFVVESNGFRWARLMRRLPREAGHRVNRSGSRTLAEADRRAVRKRYRIIPTQGGRELPEIPPRPKGKRGRIAKSDGRNPRERLVTHGKSVPRFMGGPGCQPHQQCRRAEDRDGKGQDQGVRMLPHQVPRRRMVPDPRLPELYGGTWLQPSRRNPDCARWKGRRHDQVALRPISPQE